MGCAQSTPQAVKQHEASSHKSKHGASVHAQSPAPQLPDFGVASHFKVLNMLGEGGSGETWLCINLETQEEVAVKFIPRAIPKVVVPMVLHEVRIQAVLGGGHISLVQVKELVLSKTHLALSMEYVPGGNLTAYVTNQYDSTGLRGGMCCSEPEAQYFFKQFLLAVEYLHANHVAHRDLKLDNIVLDSNTPPRIKLCDFGFAKNWEEQGNMFTQIGTPVYMSPQVISTKSTQQGYDGAKADVWACGVLLLVMLLGRFPYDHTEHPNPNSSDAHVEVWLQQIKCSWREAPHVATLANRLSDNCRDLLDKILEMDETKRIDIKAIKQHPWYTMPLPAKYSDALEALMKDQTELASHRHVNAQGAWGMSKVRDLALQKVVERAGTLHQPGDPEELARVNLGPTVEGSADITGVTLDIVEEESGEESG